MLAGSTKALAPRRAVLESVQDVRAAGHQKPVHTVEPKLEKSEIQVLVYSSSAIAPRLPFLTEFVRGSASLVSLSKHPAWLNILQTALGHEPYAIEAAAGGRTVGFLPLAFMESFLFGKFLVSLPYLNTNGVVGTDRSVQQLLIDRAVSLGEELNVRHLEFRHERASEHPALNAQITSKVHMRLPLPHSADLLWKGFDSKLRNQVRKGGKNSFTLAWGGMELLVPFYYVLTRNMRDLGSPLYSAALFRDILATFPDNAEICLVRDKEKPIAAALLLHGWGVTEVPTASSLKEYNPSSVNMHMYWHLLQRAIERGQQVFDFGRSTVDGSTYKFKKQWGAEAEPAVWQYRIASGEVGEMRPDNPRFQRAIRLWQKLPLALTRLLGPHIVRGIP